MKKGYVRASHLFYIIIIAVLILAFFLVIAFGGLENASTTMGTASTVSSLILSVIAIVMTIVDVAGQRDTVSDIKETAEKLESNLNIVNEGIEEINNLKDALLKSMGLIQESNTSIMNAVTDLKEKYSEVEDGKDKSVESKKVLQDLEKLTEQMQNSFKKSNYSLPNDSYLLNKMNLEKTNKISGGTFISKGLALEQEISQILRDKPDIDDYDVLGLLQLKGYNPNSILVKKILNEFRDK